MNGCFLFYHWDCSDEAPFLSLTWMHTKNLQKNSHRGSGPKSIPWKKFQQQRPNLYWDRVGVDIYVVVSNTSTSVNAFDEFVVIVGNGSIDLRHFHFSDDFYVLVIFD